MDIDIDESTPSQTHINPYIRRGEQLQTILGMTIIIGLFCAFMVLRIVWRHYTSTRHKASAIFEGQYQRQKALDAKKKKI